MFFIFYVLEGLLQGLIKLLQNSQSAYFNTNYQKCNFVILISTLFSQHARFFLRFQSSISPGSTKFNYCILFVKIIGLGTKCFIITLYIFLSWYFSQISMHSMRNTPNNSPFLFALLFFVFYHLFEECLRKPLRIDL